MDRILLFAGTTEGRRMAEYLERHKVDTYACVATEYGETLLTAGEHLQVHAGRLDEAEMKSLLEKEHFSMVIDATHPYAVLVSENIRRACQETGTEYVRLLRDSGIKKSEADGSHAVDPEDRSITWVDSVQAAVDFLKNTEGNILVTTGSKELPLFTDLPDYRNRVYARVLSTPEVAAACGRLGLQGKHLICMQGPFGEELNTAMLRHVEATWMVTKESGKNGGFEEKLRAAKKAGAKVVLIGRPPEAADGLGEMEVRALICRRFGITAKPKISLVGIGMGNPDNMTLEAQKAICEAELLIGAGRMLESAGREGKACLNAYRAEEIRDYLAAHPEYEKAAILLSGDVGFYSGAKKLLQVLSTREPDGSAAQGAKLEAPDIQIYSGISSLVYLCGKLGVSWEDAKLVSLHGREQNVISAVKNHPKVFALIGRKDGISLLCRKLIDYGLGGVRLSVGENLSYKNERFTTGTAMELAEQSFEPLCVVLIENDSAENRAVRNIRDEEFLRDKVPMTKEEVRCVSLAKLQLTRDALVWDVGAGTGSVSVEMALQAAEGKVYAIEKKPEAADLIQKNKNRFGADNLEIIRGLAPEALEELPAPTHVFIGGSSGNLREILQSIRRKNPRARIVINAIALETVAETMNCIREFPAEDVDIVTLAVGKSKTVGSYHMMMGQNPVYIFSFCLSL